MFQSTLWIISKEYLHLIIKMSSADLSSYRDQHFKVGGTKALRKEIYQTVLYSGL